MEKDKTLISGADERTLNKFVYFFGEVTTQEESFKLLEELSGETIPRHYVSYSNLDFSSPLFSSRGNADFTEYQGIQRRT